MIRERINFSVLLLLFAMAACQTPEAQVAEPMEVKTDSTATTRSLDGPQVITTKDGSRMEGMQRNGKRDGPWASYFENGGIRSRITYVDGVEQGPTEVYHDNGMLYYTGQYTDGKTTGEWVFFDPGGNELKRVQYDSAGVMMK